MFNVVLGLFLLVITVFLIKTSSMSSTLNIIDMLGQYLADILLIFSGSILISLNCRYSLGILEISILGMKRSLAFNEINKIYRYGYGVYIIDITSGWYLLIFPFKNHELRKLCNSIKEINHKFTYDL
jgi:hypothetical protein